MSAETVVVARVSNGNAKQILIIVNCLDYCGEYKQELYVLRRRLTGVKQIFARVGGYRPVIVLTRAVYSLIGLFVKQTDESVLLRDLLHVLHYKKIVVNRHIGGLVYGRKLVLSGRCLVMLCL